MLIFDRTHRAWAALSVVVSVVASGFYVWYANGSVNGPSGGSLPGLMFGIIAAGMMVFAGLLAARRRFPAARVGSAQFWLRGHIWIGTLTVPFALFHAGFGWGGRLEIVLWILFFTVILSGFWGLALQQVLPRMMLEQIPRETFIEQIPHLCTRFTAESDRLLADVCGPLEVSLTPVELKQFESHLRPHFEEDRKKRRNDYPKTASDAVHLQIFLAKVYGTIKSPVPVSVPEAPQAPSAGNQPPVMKSVAQVTAPPAEKPATEIPAAPAVVVSAPPVASVPAAAGGKPDAKAMLAAMKAKKAAAAQSATPISTEATTTEATPVESKPEPAESKPVEAASVAPSPAEPPAAATPVAAGGKPDPKAMLAAIKAKKEAAAKLATTASGDAAPSESTPVAATPNPPPVEAAITVAPTVVPQPAATPIAAGGKPDAKAMLAAMKAKKEAAAQSATSAPATATPGGTSTPEPNLDAAKAAPVIQQKPVRVPAATVPAAPAAAGRVAPPSKSQVAELKQFYLELIRPQLPMQPDTHRWMEAIRRSTMACGIRQDNQHPQFIDIFNQLRDLCEQRRQFAFVQRYHRWLHGWLLVHIPATVALYFVLVVHAVMALGVIPFGN